MQGSTHRLIEIYGTLGMITRAMVELVTTYEDWLSSKQCHFFHSYDKTHAISLNPFGTTKLLSPWDKCSVYFYKSMDLCNNQIILRKQFHEIKMFTRRMQGGYNMNLRCNQKFIFCKDRGIDFSV